MSFRKIKPSFGTAESSTSLSGNNQSQPSSESTGSDPSRQNPPSNAAQDVNLAGASKRRRVPESVTRNACLNCKKARAKCDGKHPCTRCSTRTEGSPCKYEVHIKHAKEELVKQIKDLKIKDQLTEHILTALSSDEQVPEILQRLKDGASYTSIVEWLRGAPIEEFETLSPRESYQSAFEPSDQEMGGVANTIFRWTSVTNDPDVFDHLFQLYFAWVHPVHTLFSEGHFVESYKRPSTHFCSTTLVNAICALACHLHSSSDSDEIDYDQLGLKFSDAVRTSLDPSDRSITTVQSFAVMFLVDCARGRCLRASSYLKVASHLTLELSMTDNERFSEVLRQTDRGIRCLNVEWAQMVFQAPSMPPPYSGDLRDDGEQHLDDAQWYYYRQPQDQCPAWPGLLATTNREKAKLIEIINDTVLMHYSPSTQLIHARHVLQLYSRLTNWRDNLPKIIGNIEDNNSQALPHVLSLLILHSTAVTHLLRPLLDFDGFPPGQVEQIVWSHAQQGLFLLNEHYRKQYTTRFQPVLQMFATLHLCDTIARFFANTSAKDDTAQKDGPVAIQIGFETLVSSRQGYPIAGPFQELLRRTAIECNIRLPGNIQELMTPPRHLKSDYKLDDFIDACTRPTYVQPVIDIHTKYSPRFTADWIVEAPKHNFHLFDKRGMAGRSEEERGAQNLMHIRNLLNMN